MIPKNIVRIFKLKINRYYWVPPNKESSNKISLTKEKYNIPKELIEVLNEQEKLIKQLNFKLTRQEKMINLMNYKLQYFNGREVLFLLKYIAYIKN